MTGRRLLAAGMLSVLVAGCGGEAADTELPLRPVRYITVADADNGRSRTFAGTSRSTQMSRLSFKVGGTIVERPVEVGDRVTAGTLLARLDRASFDLEVQQAQANLVQAEASLRNAESNYERVKGLYENNSSSRNDLDAARAQAESARAQTRASRKSLELAELNRSYTRLTADRDCTVASVNVDINENVSPGTEVARVNCGARLEVELAIPDSLINDIDAETPVEISFNAIPDLRFAGTVTEIGVSATGSSPTFPVTVRIDGSERRLRPGLAANVTFRFDNPGTTDRYLIPAAAVANDGDASYVFVAAGAGGETATVEKRTVELGDLTDDGVEILEGIAPGDRVITAGVSTIRAGQQVLVN